MNRPRRNRRPSLALWLAFAFLAFPALAYAQPLSSGSGSGTGTGASGGTTRNSTGTGQESGSRGMTGTGSESGSGPGTLPSNDPLLVPSGPLGNYGPGAGISFSEGGTEISLEQYLPPGNISGLSYVTEKQLDFAGKLSAATDRSLALSRIATAATFSAQFDLAERALKEATSAALTLEPGLIRDQRIASIVNSLMSLAEARLREPSIPVLAADPKDPAPPPAPLPKRSRDDLIRLAAADWKSASALAEQLTNITYQTEMMYRVADSMATGSQRIINSFPKLEGGTVTAATGVNTSYSGLPDQLLQDAAKYALKIKRPVWRDRGLVTVAGAAAESKQFARAMAIARLIPQPEVRSDGLLKVADTQARKGDEEGATETYREAAQAVASIPLDDPRAVLAGVLIDDLISVGRFEDARFSVALYPDQPRRLIALGAIAEAQGKRGAAASAVKWIAAEIPAQFQSLLYRKVNNGVVAAIELNRSRDLSSGGRNQ